MKQCLLLILFGAVFLTGCARNYTITLNNGARVSGIGKPRLEGASYVFKDAKGQPIYVPAGRVREIAPTSMMSARQSSGFKASPSN
jgi:hypothetical protein